MSQTNTRPQVRKYAAFPAENAQGSGGKPVYAGKSLTLNSPGVLHNQATVTLTSEMEAGAMANLAAQLMDEKKGRDITVLDVRAVSSLADYFIIGTADSRPQIRAIAESIRYEFAKQGIRPIAPPTRYAPQGSEGWQLLDFGDIIVHVLSPEDRAFYQLEAFWDHADVVDSSVWQNHSV